MKTKIQKTTRESLLKKIAQKTKMVDITIAKLYCLVNKQLESTGWQSLFTYEPLTFGKVK